MLQSRFKKEMRRKVENTLAWAPILPVSFFTGTLGLHGSPSHIGKQNRWLKVSTNSWTTKVSMVLQACSTHTPEAKREGSPVWGHPGPQPRPISKQNTLGFLNFVKYPFLILSSSKFIHGLTFPINHNLQKRTQFFDYPFLKYIRLMRVYLSYDVFTNLIISFLATMLWPI